VDPNAPSTTTEPAASSAGAHGPAGEELSADEAPQGSRGFASETLAELRKVVWPSRQQLFSESVAVVLMVGLSAAAIAAVDRFYGWVASQVFR
jgi:preprotein translocase subunit SecE